MLVHNAYGSVDETGLTTIGLDVCCKACDCALTHLKAGYIASIKLALVLRHAAADAHFSPDGCGYASMTTSNATRTPCPSLAPCCALQDTQQQLGFGSHVVYEKPELAVVTCQMILTKLVWEPQVICEEVGHVVVQLL